jgi:hypothetical protein
MLMAAGWDVTLRPTVPDVPVGSGGGDWGDES